MTSGWDRYLDLVRRIPSGRVATYGTISALTGSPRAARQVGYALAAAGDGDVPWHRVVGRRGRAGVGISLRGPTGDLQRALLADEGVEVADDGAIGPANEWRGDGDDPEGSRPVSSSYGE